MRGKEPHQGAYSKWTSKRHLIRWIEHLYLLHFDDLDPHSNSSDGSRSASPPSPTRWPLMKLCIGSSRGKRDCSNETHSLPSSQSYAWSSSRGHSKSSHSCLLITFIPGVSEWESLTWSTRMTYSSSSKNLYMVGISDRTASRLLDITGFQCKTFLFRYLGIPLAIKKLRTSNYGLWQRQSCRY